MRRLQATGLRVSRGGRLVLADLDVDAAAGQLVAVVGPSGCGKSTLLNVLAGIEPPTRGTVELLGESVYALDEGRRSALRLRRVGFIFQRFHLLHVLTAAENVELPMAEAGIPTRARRERAVRHAPAPRPRGQVGRKSGTDRYRSPVS